MNLLSPQTDSSSALTVVPAFSGTKRTLLYSEQQLRIMSSASIPASVKQWTVKGTKGLDSLVLVGAPVPEIGDNQVLVKSIPSTPPALKPVH